jgi:hypothetical protein
MIVEYPVSDTDGYKLGHVGKYLYHLHPNLGTCKTVGT